MSYKTASLVINPRTGQNLAKITDVLTVLAAAGWKTELGIKEYGGHSMELANVAAQDKSDLVIAYGGDGTINQVINGVMNAKKNRSIVGVIPGGTANLWAGDIGVPSDPVQAALALVNSEERKVDLGRVSIQEIVFPDGKRVTVAGKTRKLVRKARHHFLLMAGLGMDAAVMSGVSKPLKYRVGPLAIGLSAAKELPTQHPFPIEVWTADGQHEGDMLWKGDAIQVVIGNTRRYAIVLEMTPDAYIDDGVLDVSVITGGNPLTTVQQLSSLLLRRKPDNVSTEFFHGAHLCIKVPASVPLELDGSTIQLKDYLSKSDYVALQQTENQEQTMITYRFDALPGALTFAIPRTYSGNLFEHAIDEKPLHEHKVEVPEPVAVRGRNDKEGSLTPMQAHTLEHETQPLHKEEAQEHDKQKDVASKEVPTLVSALLEHGRKVTVVGKAPNPAGKHAYIVAGTAIKQGSAAGDTKPVAVVVNGKTNIFTHEGMHAPSEALEDLQAGTEIVVEGKKSKRGVIAATRIVL